MRLVKYVFLILIVSSCKNIKKDQSNLMVVNGTPVTSQKQAKEKTPGTYGIQNVYVNSAGDIKQQEATGFFTDKGGTTFITVGHNETNLRPPAGYTQKGNTRIVDYRGETVREVTPSTNKYINPGSNRPDRDLAMWHFPDGTKNLPHGSASFAPKGYDLTKQNLTLAGYGTNTNSANEKGEYQKLRFGPVGNIDNPTGNTFGYRGPQSSNDKSNFVSSAPGDSGGVVYGSNNQIVGINRGGTNEGSKSSYSEAINPYAPGATSFFKEVKARGGVVDGWNGDH